MSLILLMTGCTVVEDQKDSIGTTASSSVHEADEARVTGAVKASDSPCCFEYDPYVVSDMYRDTMGEDMYMSYMNFVDAVENGETQFECCGYDEYGWLFGQYIPQWAPFAAEYTIADYYEDGIVHFHYTLPEDEIREYYGYWKNMVTDIINNCGIQEGDSDFEKAFMLYYYISYNYEYDYDALDNLDSHTVSAYRFLTEGRGICSDVSEAYTFLLGQVGVDSAPAHGPSDDPDTQAHEWTVIHINDGYYNIDATWAMGKEASPDLFMFSDSKRYRYGLYAFENTHRVNNYPYEMDESYVSPYVCDDETMDIFTCSSFVDLDHENNIIYYMTCEDGCVLRSFDFSSYT